MTHYIIVREDGPGRFIAHPCGIPELTVTAAGRADAITAATAKLNEWFLAGRLVPVRLPGFGNTPSSPVNPPSDSDEYMQRVFEDELERSRREDLERTLAEYEAECRSTSSTPTT
ncbi:MAG TPA: hypothetical protein VKD71_02540 [Gemmataceae bacterium]|nr:hypothetical protein [Gemmataceae bacterium]